MKKKKKIANVDYGKISTAIGRFKSLGIDILPPNVNVSNFTFLPNEKDNTITYGLRGITRISTDLINKIIKLRPYSSLDEFITKVEPTKVQIVNLIKSGAMDTLEKNKTRVEIMEQYIKSIVKVKDNITLQSMNLLLEKDIIPDTYAEQKEAYAFNKFLKSKKTVEDFYELSDKAVDYVSRYFDGDIIDGNQLNKKAWDKVYNKKMDDLRDYLKNNKEEIIDKINEDEFNETWEKYASGTISKWEMDSIGFYNHEHELEKIKKIFDNYNKLPEDPVVERKFTTKDGHDVAIYKLNVIVGTVVNKDKAHNIVSLLTPNGLAQVKIYKSQWSKYDRKISVTDNDGHKVTLDDSWLSRGNLLLIQGIKRDGNFVPKKYSSSIYPPIARIDKVNDDGTINITTERVDVE